MAVTPTHSEVGRRRTNHRITARDGTPLSVVEWTGHATTRRTIVFLHGLCLNRSSWTTQINHLLRRSGPDTRVISYDHRGHGASGSAPMRTYTVDQLADDLDQVLTALCSDSPVILVGHSLGAMVALSFLAQPSRACNAPVRGLVLCATAAGRLTEYGIGRLLATPALGALVSVVDHAPLRATRALASPLCATLTRLRSHGGAEHQTLTALTATALTTTALSTAVGFLPSLRDYDKHDALSSIRVHTTIISGGADLLTPPVHSEQMAASIAGATHLHIPSAGHMLPQQAPHCVSDAIRRTIAATTVSPLNRPLRSPTHAAAQ